MYGQWMTGTWRARFSSSFNSSRRLMTQTPGIFCSSATGLYAPSLATPANGMRTEREPTIGCCSHRRHWQHESDIGGCRPLVLETTLRMGGWAASLVCVSISVALYQGLSFLQACIYTSMFCLFFIRLYTSMFLSPTSGFCHTLSASPFDWLCPSRLHVRIRLFV